jgi:hypothetical protein
VPARPTLVRWDPARPLGAANLAVLDAPDADTHARECFGVAMPAPGARRAGAFVDAPDATPDEERELPPLARRTPVEVWGQAVQDLFERRAREVEEWTKAVVASG